MKAGFWVAAALRLAHGAGQSGMVLRRGDADAGGVLAVLRGRGGFVVLSRISDPQGEAWMRATGPDPVEEAAADAYVARQTARDPDLWVLEFDAPSFLPPFAARIVG